MKIGWSFYVSVGVHSYNGQHLNYTVVAPWVRLNDTATFTLLRNRMYQLSLEVANDGIFDLTSVAAELVGVPQGFTVDRRRVGIGSVSVGSGEGQSFVLTTPPEPGDYLIELRVSSKELERSYSLQIIVT